MIYTGFNQAGRSCHYCGMVYPKVYVGDIGLCNDCKDALMPVHPVQNIPSIVDFNKYTIKEISRNFQIDKKETQVPKTIYVAGPMRGIPHFNFPAFDKSRDFLKSKGWSVISPADLDRDAGDCDYCKRFGKQECDLHRPVNPDGDTNIKVIQRDIASVLLVDALALLPGWENSVGANAELALAKWRNIPIIDAFTGEPYEPSILQEALRITRGDRQDAYGHPLDEHQKIADLWSALLGRPLTPLNVADMMILLKMARNQHKRRRDNYVDSAGYSECGWKIVEETERRAQVSANDAKIL